MKSRSTIIFFGWVILHTISLTSCAEKMVLSEEKGSARKTPNVILIYADDLGRGLLSIEGQKIIQTPNIDRLADEGIRFENAYGGMFCAPARASLITGYHDAHGDKWNITSGGAYMNISRGTTDQQQIESKINDQLGKIAADEIFLPQVFKNAGYVTGEVGKLEWGFSATDAQMKRHGWDYYYGYLDHVRCHGFYPPFLFENGTLVEIEGNTHANCGKSIEPETQEAFEERWNMEGKTTYSQDLFIDKILGFIRENKEKPFFLYHPTQLPHGPVAIPEVAEAFKDDTRLTQIEKEYASMVKMLDDQVGLIMRELKNLEIDEDTLVIFTSDNGHEIYYSQEGRILKPVRNMEKGEFFDNITTKFYSDIGGDVFDGNDGMAGIKRSNWEGGARVPLIARWPSKIKPGSKSKVLASNYDFMTTMADLVGFELPETKDGVSYLSALLSEDGPRQEYIVYSSFMGPAIVNKEGWKLRYFSEDDIFQLYFLPDDYKETNNIIASNEAKAAELKNLLMEECNGDLSNGWFKTRTNILPAIE